MTTRQYLRSHATTGWVRISEIIPAPIPILRTQESWFHPKGGGQQADQGIIGTARVLSVVENAGEVDHIVDSIEEIELGNEYPFKIDETLRTLNAAYHTAGHLLMNILESEHRGLHGVKGHHWPGEARVIFEGALARPVEIISLNATIAFLLGQDLPVEVSGDSDSIRTIRIGEFQPIPCGGVHVQSLSQIQRITVTQLKQKKDSISLHYGVIPRS